MSDGWRPEPGDLVQVVLPDEDAELQFIAGEVLPGKDEGTYTVVLIADPENGS